VLVPNPSIKINLSMWHYCQWRSFQSITKVD